MLLSGLVASTALLSNVVALVPRAFSAPGSNGFPNPSPEQQAVIAKQAGGKLPGGPLPTELGPGSTTAFQLIAFNEIFETSFFNSLLVNITDKVAGYELDDGALEPAQKIVKTVLAVSPFSRRYTLTFIILIPNSKRSSTLSQPSLPSTRPRSSLRRPASTSSPSPLSRTQSSLLRPSLPSSSALFKVPTRSLPPKAFLMWSAWFHQ